MFQIIAIVTLKNGAAEKFKPMIAPLVAASLKDKGNISYECKQDAFNPDVFIFQEKWESDAALEAHMEMPHFKKFGSDTEALLAGPLALHKIML